jgi:hypothetical protein
MMRNKQKQPEQLEQSAEHIVMIADGEFSAPNLIRNGEEWVGIPPHWLHLVPNRYNLQRVKIVLQLEYRGENDGEAEE